MSYVIDLYSGFYPQNGICIKYSNFWLESDGEKWSRKNSPPCGSHFLICKFILLTTFEENLKSSSKNNHIPAWKKI